MNAADLPSAQAFSHFPQPQLARLGECVAVHLFDRNQRIFTQGDAPGAAYLLVEGRIEIESDTAYGSIHLATIAPGEIFGEVSFVDDRPRSTSARSSVASRILVLDAPSLRSAADHDPRFDLCLYWSFWRSLSDKLRTSIEQLTTFFPGDGDGAVEPAPPAADAGSVTVGLAAKRSLFEDQTLSRLEISMLSSLSQEKRFAPGDTIFRDGDTGDAMYVVLDGQVRISKQLAGAGEEALAVLGRGDYFGEMALIDDRPRTADARAHEAGAVVLAIPSEVVSRLLDIDRFSSIRLLRVLCRLAAKRLREIDDKLASWHIMSAAGHQSLSGDPLD